jgi:hypothetical protein
MIMRSKRDRNLRPIRLCAVLPGSLRGRSTVLSTHESVVSALRWGRISGLAVWPAGRTEMRMWIDRVEAPARKETR